MTAEPDSMAVEAAFERLAKDRPHLLESAVTPWVWVLGGPDDDEEVRAYHQERCRNRLRVAEEAGWTWNAERARFVRPGRARVPYVAAWVAAIAVVVLAVIAAVVGGAVAAAVAAGLGAVALVGPIVIWIERQRRTS